MSEKEVLRLILKDSWMMEVLQAVSSLQLPDWWIGAGFVRNKVWDELHGYKKRTLLNDIDVIYFDDNDIAEEDEKELEKVLKKIQPNLPWSVKNQARMAIIRGDGPYKNAEDGLSRWVETATCVGVRLKKGELILSAPLGVNDLATLVIRLNTKAGVSREVFNKRVRDKKWLEIWPKLQVVL